jgi:hypothetical protein
MKKEGHVAAQPIPPLEPQPTEQLSKDQSRALAKETFLWGMHPIAIYNLRYMHLQNERSPFFVGIARLSWEGAANRTDSPVPMTTCPKRNWNELERNNSQSLTRLLHSLHRGCLLGEKCGLVSNGVRLDWAGKTMRCEQD